MTNETPSEEELFMSDENSEVTQEQEPATVLEQPVETPEPSQEELKAESVDVPIEPETALEANAKPTAEEPTSEAQVPSWRLRELREAKEAEIAKQTAALEQERTRAAQAQAQLQQLQQQLNQQQQKPVPDIFENPDEWQSHYISQQQQQMEQFQKDQQEKMAQLEAYTLHGVEQVNAAKEAAFKANQSNPAVSARILSASNPFSEMVNWHKEQQVYEQIGEGGIGAFRDRTRQELMKDPEFRKQVIAELKGEAGGVATPQTPTSIPSLNGAPRVSTPSNGDPIMSDAELFNSQ